jgi:hypothetical protein
LPIPIQLQPREFIEFRFCGEELFNRFGAQALCDLCIEKIDGQQFREPFKRQLASCD